MIVIAMIVKLLLVLIKITVLPVKQEMVTKNLSCGLA